MWGTPQRSRTTRTGAERSSASTPVDAGGGVRRAHPAVAATHTAAAKRVRLRRMALKEALLAEYDHEMGTTRKLLERVPDAQLSWRPHQKSMSLGGLATHLANIPNWGGTILSDRSYDLAGGPPNMTECASRAEILRLFDDSTRRTRAAMDKSDAEYMDAWTLKRA